MIKLNKLNSLILNNNINNNRIGFLINYDRSNELNLKNFLDLLKKKLLIFLDIYLINSISHSLVERFFFKFNKTFSSRAMLSLIKFNKGLRFIVVNKKKRKRRYNDIVPLRERFRLYKDAFWPYTRSLIDNRHISRRSLSNAKRHDYRKGKHQDRYKYNKNKKKNSRRKKMTASRRAKNDFKRRKRKLGICEILARRCLHKIARTNPVKKRHQVIKIISNNKYIYKSNNNRIKVINYRKNAFNPLFKKDKFLKALTSLALVKDIKKEESTNKKKKQKKKKKVKLKNNINTSDKNLKVSKKYNKLKILSKIYDRLNNNTLDKKFKKLKARVNKYIFQEKKKRRIKKRRIWYKIITKASNSLNNNNKKKRFIKKNRIKNSYYYQFYYINLFPIDFLNKIIPNKKKLQSYKNIINNKSNTFLRKKTNSSNLIENMFNTNDLFYNKKNIYLLTLLKNDIVKKSIKKNKYNKLAKIKRLSSKKKYNKNKVNLSLIKSKIAKKKYNKNRVNPLLIKSMIVKKKDRYLNILGRFNTKKNETWSMLNLYYNRDYMSNFNKKPTYNMFKYDPPYLSNTNSEYMKEFLIREAYKIKRNLSFNKILIGKREENQPKLIRKQSFKTNFIEAQFKELVLRILPMRKYPKIEMWTEAAYMYVKVRKYFHYVFNKILFIYKLSLKENNISRIYNLNNLLGSNSYDPNIIDHSDIYRYNNQMQEKNYSSLNLYKSNYKNEMSFFINKYSTNYYSYSYKYIPKLYIDPLRDFTFPLPFIMHKKNQYLNKLNKIYYKYFNYIKWLCYSKEDFFKFKPEESYNLREETKEYDLFIKPRLSNLLKSIEEESNKKKTFSVWQVFFDQFKSDNQKYLNNN